MNILRAIREFFGYREVRYGVRYLRGRYERLDFTSRKAAEEWAWDHLPLVRTGQNARLIDWVTFSYTPLELYIDRSRRVSRDMVTPDSVDDVRRF